MHEPSMKANESGRFEAWLATGRVQCNKQHGKGDTCSVWARLIKLFLTGASRCAD